MSSISRFSRPWVTHRCVTRAVWSPTISQGSSSSGAPGAASADAARAARRGGRGCVGRVGCVARLDAAQLVADGQTALQHASAADAPDVVAPGERADLHEKRRVEVDLGGRHRGHDGLEQVAHAARGKLDAHGRREDAAVGQVLLAVALLAAVLLDVVDDPALEARAVKHGKVELLVGGAQLDEQVEGRVERARRVGVGPVGLVDDHDGPQPQAQRAHEHVAGLGHGAFVGVDQQEHGVDHAEHALYLAAEVGVAGGVDDVDEVVLPLHCAVLAADRDAALALEVVAVHDALLDVGVLAEHAGGAEDGVDQGGLAVVDVGDDGEVADVGWGMHGKRLSVGVLCGLAGEASRGGAAAPPRLASQCTRSAPPLGRRDSAGLATPCPARPGRGSPRGSQPTHSPVNIS